MSAHTPGPWAVAGESGDYFATAADYSPLPATAENARLIAAAPDMLKALQRLTHPMTDDDDIQNALEVIAQATGEAK